MWTGHYLVRQLWLLHLFLKHGVENAFALISAHAPRSAFLENNDHFFLELSLLEVQIIR